MKLRDVGAAMTSLLVLGDLTGAAASGTVESFPRRDGSCSLGVQTLNWHFSGPGWSDARKGQVRAGVSAWDGYLDRDGDSYIDSTFHETATGNSVPFELSSTRSHIDCTNGSPDRIFI